jgi:hypothetical protein
MDASEQSIRPEIVSQVSRHQTLAHQAAADFLSRPHLSDSPSVLACYPAVSFTWYAQTWAAIYSRRMQDMTKKNERACAAAEKLEAALARLNDLEAAIEDQKQLVEQKKLVANRLLANVGQETALLNEQKVVLQDDEKVERMRAAQLDAMRLEIVRQSEKMKPHQEKMEETLTRVEAHTLSELRSVATPTDSVLTTFKAVAVLLTMRGKRLPGHDALSWKELRKLFAKPDAFVAQLNRSVVRLCAHDHVCNVHLSRRDVHVFVCIHEAR